MPFLSALFGLFLATHVVPPGQEKLLKSMVGTAGAQKGWTFKGAQIDKTVIHVRYSRGGALVTIDLAYPDQATPGAKTTKKFAILPPQNPPEGLDLLLAQLEERLAKGETGWQWLWVDDDAPRDPGPEGAPQANLPRDPSGDSQGARLRISELLARADHSVKTHDFAVVEELVQKALEEGKTVYPLGRPAWFDLWVGQIYRGASKVDAAKEHFDAAVKAAEARSGPQVSPDEAFQNQLNRARALLWLGKADEAQKAIAALDAQSDSVERRCSRAVLARDHADLGAPDKAIAHLKAIAALEPKCPKLYVMAGDIGRAHKKLDEVGDLLAQGAKLFPDDSPVVTQLADYYKFKDRRDEAILTLEALVDRGHAEPGMIGELLGLYTRAGIPDETVAKFKGRADANTEDYISAFFGGVLLHYKQKYEESNRYLDRARKPLPNEPRLYIYLAMNHFHLGNQPLASELIERGVQVGMEDPDVYYCRAIINTDTNPEGAIRDLERYLTLTKTAFDVFEPKQKIVAAMLERMRGCVDARVPSECINLQKKARTGLFGLAGVGLVILVGVPFFIAMRKRRKAAAGAATLLLALGLGFAAPARAQATDPGHPPGIEAAPPFDASRLLAGFDPGPGWKLGRIQARPERIALGLVADDGSGLDLVLVKRGEARRPLATTRSFDVYYTGHVDSSPGSPAWALLQNVIAHVRQKDDGSIQLVSQVEKGLGPMAPSTLAAQLTWMPPLDLAQAGVSFALLVAGVFFSGSPRGA